MVSNLLVGSSDLITWSPVSHAYIKFYSESYDRWLIYQASGTKVNFIGETLFDSTELIYKEFELPASGQWLRLKPYNSAIDKCGLPYSILQKI